MAPTTAPNIPSCDLFCRVIDNYGDIGVSWRLARQLTQEYGWQVRLLVDDLASLHKLWPSVNTLVTQQSVQGIEIYRWDAHLPNLTPAAVVIEAFACNPPPTYIAQMAQMRPPPIWINLEYLSGEAWVAGCHGMTSIHPQFGLRKTFFFPGFTEQAGGLLREAQLLAERKQFMHSPEARSEFLHALGIAPNPHAENVLLFSYANSQIPALLDAWAMAGRPMQVLLPPTPAVPQVHAWLAAHPQTGVQVHNIPFVPQDQFDHLLWACDTLLVRGEDSAVRALWTGKPLLWQLYPQAENAHLNKLAAFLDWYCADLPAQAAQAQRALHLAWNGTPNDGTANAPLAQTWADWAAARPILAAHADALAEKFASQPSLADKLVKHIQQAQAG